ncbi:hypothetical protein F5148DRAFT_495249 [Russula earlei]|uniref:Uncharacterized protein n=1 Tax=Russula earlei TaxID=71964 RepID=A0ACC0TXQ9_9AGAM|nr:hypothetical protein F5148DRAFT_495249 [Russula earlei]
MPSHSDPVSAYFRRAPRPNGCPFCAQPDHGVRRCTIAEEYCYNGRIVIRNARLHLPNGQLIPNSGNGRGLKDAVDAWLAANSAQVLSYPATLTVPTPVALPSSHHPPSSRDASVSTPTQLRCLQRELDDLITSSSRLRMRDQDGVSKYYRSFTAICKPLVHARRLSYEDCDESFWLGLHPDSPRMASRRLGPWRLNPRLREYFEFQKVFDTLVDIFSQHPRDIQWERDLVSLKADPRILSYDDNDEDLSYPTYTVASSPSAPASVVTSDSPAAIVPTSSTVPVTSFTAAIFDSPASSSVTATVPTSPVSAAISTQSAVSPTSPVAAI